MPTISRFFGVRIKMYLNDHPPPHFHAEYEHRRAKYSIETLELLAGSLPRRVQAFVLEWAMIHRPELRENWIRSVRRERMSAIAGLDEEA